MNLKLATLAAAAVITTSSPAFSQSNGVPAAIDGVQAAVRAMTATVNQLVGKVNQLIAAQTTTQAVTKLSTSVVNPAGQVVICSIANLGTTPLSADFRLVGLSGNVVAGASGGFANAAPGGTASLTSNENAIVEPVRCEFVGTPTGSSLANVRANMTLLTSGRPTLVLEAR